MLDDLNVKIDYFVERKCTPSWCIKKSLLTFHDLTYVKSGASTYIVNDIPYKLQQGDFIYIPEGCSREAFTDPENPMHCYAFNFQCIFPALGPVTLPLPTRFHWEGPVELLNLYHSFNKLWLEKKPGYLLEARAILMLILYRLVSYCSGDVAATPDERRIELVKDYIVKHFYKKIGMDVLANLCNLHPAYFGSFFRKKTGQSVKDYIQSIRIHKASDLLSTGGYSVGEVASLCGFEDIYYFSKVFKKITGYPPSRLLKE